MGAAGPVQRGLHLAPHGIERQSAMISYRIDCSDTRSHQFHVALTVPEPAAEQRLSLPVWIPGSYLVREFARHLSSRSRPAQDGRPVPLRQLDKASWRASCERRRGRWSCATASTRSTRRCAPPSSTPRAASSTAPASACASRAASTSRMRSRSPALPAGWEVATALRRATRRRSARVRRARLRRARRPPGRARPLLARSLRGRAACRTSSSSPAPGPTSTASGSLADTRRLCETEIAFWHGRSGRPPFERYVFLLNALDDGHGGLEHPRQHGARRAASRPAAARAAPATAPAAVAPADAGAPAPDRSDGYVGVLGLIAHEYFHAWNVKRLRPRDFATLDYTRENYTELLWFFEGFTSYYDDLLRRAQRPRRRAALPEAARQDRQRACWPRRGAACRASPRRASTPGSSTTAPTRTRRTRRSATTPRARWSRSRSTSPLRTRGPRHARRRHAAALAGERRRRRSTRPTSPARSRRSAAARSRRSSPPGSTAPTSCRCASLLARVGVAVDRPPATLAQRLGVRVSEGALTGVKVSHVLRGGAGERRASKPATSCSPSAAGACAGSTTRCAVSAATVPRRCWSARDQRVLSLDARPRRPLRGRRQPCSCACRETASAARAGAARGMVGRLTRPGRRARGRAASRRRFVRAGGRGGRAARRRRPASSPTGSRPPRPTRGGRCRRASRWPTCARSSRRRPRSPRAP